MFIPGWMIDIEYPLLVVIPWIPWGPLAKGSLPPPPPDPHPPAGEPGFPTVALLAPDCGPVRAQCGIMACARNRKWVWRGNLKYRLSSKSNVFVCQHPQSPTVQFLICDVQWKETPGSGEWNRFRGTCSSWILQGWMTVQMTAIIRSKVTKVRTNVMCLLQ